LHPALAVQCVHIAPISTSLFNDNWKDRVGIP
jgi:hypothetical protein